MDIYRKFIKQTYKTYHKNPKLRQFFISVYKNNIKTPILDKNNQTITVTILKKIIELMIKIKKQQQNDSQISIINPKKQMEMTFILHPSIQIKDIPMQSLQQKKSYQLFCWIQFYYLLYIGKIYVKEILGGKKYFQRYLMDFDGTIKINMDSHIFQSHIKQKQKEKEKEKEKEDGLRSRQIIIKVPINNQRLSSLF